MVDLVIKNGIVEYADVSRVHGHGAMCSICHKEINVFPSLKDWIFNSCRHAEPDTPIEMPCGHWTSPQEFDESLIFIDEWIVSYISKMNISGYLTTYSCSGHNTRLMSGYVSFLDTYEDLADYIIHHPRLLNIIDLEYWYVNKKDYVVSVYDRDNKIYKTESVIKARKNSDDHIVIRLKNGYKFSKTYLSKFEKLTLFRRCLNDIAKWCVKSKAYREKNRLKLGAEK